MENKEAELAADLAVSVIRDLLAGLYVAGRNAQTVDLPSDRILADEAYSMADSLLARSRTPQIINALKEGKKS